MPIHELTHGGPIGAAACCLIIKAAVNPKAVQTTGDEIPIAWESSSCVATHDLVHAHHACGDGDEGTLTIGHDFKLAIENISLPDSRLAADAFVL